jgi:hypothetical protein
MNPLGTKVSAVGVILQVVLWQNEELAGPRFEWLKQWELD